MARRFLNTAIGTAGLLAAGVVATHALDTRAQLPTALVPEPPADAGGEAAIAGWHRMPVGAGGYVTGIDVAADGTMVVRTDTYGGYIWDQGGGRWRQLVRASSMPAPYNQPDREGPAYEVVVAGGSSSLLYMAYAGTVFRSDDKGERWTKTALGPVFMNATEHRLYGGRMAVDPRDPQHLLVGTQRDGLWRTTDGGKSFAKISVPDGGALPDGTRPGVTGITFHPRGETVGGRTAELFASVFGHGVFRSADGGTTWAQLTGGPSHAVRHACIATDGVFYATDWSASDVSNRSGNRVWRWNGNWTDLGDPAGGSGNHSVLCDPFNPERIIVGNDGGSLIQSRNRGASWDGQIQSVTRRATDIPWLAWTNEGYMSNGEQRFHPTIRDRILFAEGIGVWMADVSPTASAVSWVSWSRGIEQLVPNQILSPPGGQLVLASWDRPIFHIADPTALRRFPAVHGPDRDDSIQMAWSLDYAATDPSYLVALINWGKEKSGYSTDGGRSWRKFASEPSFVASGKIGGSIAVSTPSNIVWAPNNNGRPVYTKDGGTTWRVVSFPGAPTGDDSGWGWAYYFNRRVVTADKVRPGTFYAYNYLAGVYRTLDGGDTWTLIKPGKLTTWSSFHAKLKAVPGREGHLFFSSGHQSGEQNPADEALMRSTDGGASWREVKGVKEVYDFGFGRPQTAGGYPAVFIAGWVNGDYGIWMSEDDARTWRKMTTFPIDSLDQVRVVEGDMNVFGRAYVGFGGSGYAWGQIGAGLTEMKARVAQ